jgi:hypothetical protein
MDRQKIHENLWVITLPPKLETQAMACVGVIFKVKRTPQNAQESMFCECS